MDWVCEQCGYSAPDNARFCGECGAGRQDSVDLADTLPADISQLPPKSPIGSEVGEFQLPSTSDPFSVPFEAEVGESVTIGLEPTVRWGRGLLLLLFLAAAFAGGYFIQTLRPLETTDLSGPHPSTDSHEQFAAQPLGPSGPADNGQRADVVVEVDDEQPPIYEVAAATNDAAQPLFDPAAVEVADLSAPVPPAEAALAEPVDLPSEVPPPGAIEPIEAKLPIGLLPIVVDATVNFALDRATRAALQRPGVVPRLTAPTAQALPPSEPLPERAFVVPERAFVVPERAFVVIDRSRMVGLAASFLRHGDIDQATLTFETANLQLGDDIDLVQTAVATDLHNATQLVANIEGALADLRCRDARALTRELSSISPRLGRRHRRRLDDCILRWEEAQGLPPRTLE